MHMMEAVMLLMVVVPLALASVDAAWREYKRRSHDADSLSANGEG